MEKTGHWGSRWKNPQAKSQRQHPSKAGEIRPQGRGFGAVRGVLGSEQGQRIPKTKGKGEGRGQEEGTRKRKGGEEEG